MGQLYYNLFEKNLGHLNYKLKVLILKFLQLVRALLQRNYLSRMVLD